MRAYRCVALLALLLVTACGTPEAGQAPPPAPASAPTTAAPLGDDPSAPPAPTEASPAVPAPTTEASPAVPAPTTEPSPAVPAPTTAGTLPTVDPALAVTTVLRTTTFPAVGAGRLLRDLLPSQTLAAAPLTTLIYSEVVRTPGRPSRTNAFWALDLRQPSQRRLLTTVPSNWHLDQGLFGRLSADGQYIAYLDPVDTAADLYVMRRDGSARHLVAGGLSRAASLFQHQLAWSPTGAQLAYMQYWEQGQGFYVYDAAAGTAPRELTRVGGASLKGWLDDTHILIAMVTSQTTPLQLTAIDAMTGAQEALATFPREEEFFAQVAPDRRTVWMAEYLFDVATRRFTKVEAASGFTVWMGDNTRLLREPQGRAQPAQLVTLAAAPTVQAVALLPTTQVTTGITLQGASPDGRYLAGCGGATNAQGQVIRRTLLYDVQANQWHILTEGPSCGDIIGWLAEP